MDMNRIRRLRRAAAPLTVVTTAMVLVTGAFLTTAQSQEAPIASTPVQDVPMLACDGGLAIITHAGYYVPARDSRNAAQSPDAALNRYLAAVYPGARRDGAFARTGNDGSDTKYEFRDSRGLRASVIVAESGNEYYMEEFALCESLATRWAK